MNKEQIYKIKYFDAYYLYDRECPKTKLSVHEAYGYVEKYKGTIIVHFIKKIENVNDRIIKGLFLPKNSLVSRSTLSSQVLKDVKLHSKVSLEWDDVDIAANISIRESSIMKTVGILEAIELDHIVLSNPDTKRIYPLPEKAHPEKRATYYVIPTSCIKNIIELK